MRGAPLRFSGQHVDGAKTFAIAYNGSMATGGTRIRVQAWCVFLSIAAGIALLDLWTKHAIFELLEVESVGEPPRVVSQDVLVVIPDLFELEATYNRGALYGLFAGHTNKLAILSAVAVLVILGIFAFSLRQQESPGLLFVAALALICAGTLGNLYDRWLLGAVRDWIKWFVVWGGEERVWPNFNIADSAICTGVGLFILLEVRGALNDREKRRKEKEVARATRQ